MEPDEQQRLQPILRVAQFVLNRKTETFRKEIYEFLIGIVFDEFEPDTTLGVDEIVNKIESLLGLENYPKEPVQEAVQSMHRAGDLLELKSGDNPKYTPPPNKLQEIRISRKKYTHLRSKVVDELISLAKFKMGRISKSVQIKIIKTFDYVLGQISAANSIHVTIQDSKKPSGFLGHTDSQSLVDYISNATKLYMVGEKRRITQKILEEYLMNQSDTLSSYLHSVSAAYYIVQILHLDPECQGVTREELQKITVYLDTNVIMSLLLGLDYLRDAISELISLLKNQGITLKFTTETRDEFRAVLNGSRKTCEQISMPNQRFEKIAPILEDGFVKDYLRKKARQPTLTVSGYFSRLEHVDSILLNKYGICMDADYQDKIVSDRDFPVLMRILINFSPKTHIVAEHDVLHIILIQNLRNNEACGILGPKYWFLTMDYALLRAEHTLDRVNRIQSCIQPDQLTQMLSPVLSPDTSGSELPHIYAALIRSRIADAGVILNEKDLLKIQGPWMDYADLGTEDIAEIIGKEHIQNYLHTTPLTQISSDDISVAFEPVIEEMRLKRELAKEAAERNKRMNIVKGILTLSLVVIFNVILLILSISYLTLSIGISVFGITIAIQLGIMKLFEKEIRSGFGLKDK